MRSQGFKITSDSLAVQAGLFYRRWSLGARGLQTRVLRLGDWTLPLADQSPFKSECHYDGLLRLFMHRSEVVFPKLELLKARSVKAGPGAGYEGNAERLRLAWREPVQGIVLERIFSTYAGVDAVVSAAAIKAESVPQLDFGRADYLNVVDALPIDLAGWEACAVSFYGRTDYTNDLVRHERRRIGTDGASIALHGNLLFLEPPQGGRGLFILREAPPMGEQRPECAADFLVGAHGVQALGWGIAPHDILSDHPRWSYAVSVGGYVGGELARLNALRKLLQVRYPNRSHLRAVVANPWGDGHCHQNLSEAFVLKELEACAALGITHYQIDDGWQAGGTLADLSISNMARAGGYWNVHKAKFPRAFKPLAERARALGVNLSLWFAPDANRHYRNWREEAALILEMRRRFGIQVFKIDNVLLRTREAEENFISLLETVIKESDGRAWFNLDVTNGRRLGYFANLRYGSLFVENRYVREGVAASANTYVPWRVLRNLWQLARYVPPQRLQFEFPNRHKPFFKTAEDVAVAFAMPDCRDDYLAAIPLMASPLCWAEPSGLPAAAQAEIRTVLALHHRIRGDLVACHIFPVGDEPSGRNWTGFQAIDPLKPQNGYLLVFRETARGKSHCFPLLGGGADAALRWECLSHPQDAACPKPTSDGLKVTIARPDDYRLFRYFV